MREPSRRGSSRRWPRAWGDSREAYRFLTPALVDAGYRVAAADLFGCGESSAEWTSYTRTDIAGDLVALVRHLGSTARIHGRVEAELGPPRETR